MSVSTQDAAALTAAAGTTKKSSERSLSPLFALALCSVLLVVLSVALYAPVTFNSFTSDDMVHVNWLHRAIVHPELVWRNFTHSWLDVQTARFYRPLVSVTFFTDYLLWHDNATGFHLTNALFNGATAAFFFLFLFELERTVHRGRSFASCLIFPVAAAALFAAFPAHGEAVSWITGRVDAVMAAFFTMSMWCYIRWRTQRRTALLILALLAGAASFCSKEMALALPPTLFALEFFCLAPAKSFWMKLYSAWHRTRAFWALLAVYFAVRTYALGTAIGGYDDRLLIAGSIDAQLRSWAQGIKMLILPFNGALVDLKYFAAKGWITALGIGIFSSVFVLGNRTERGKLWFLLAFSAFSLAPVYKLFCVSPVLECSRFAYLFSLPLCALICLGMSSAASSSRIPPLRAFMLAVISLLIISSAGLLLKNNRAWVSAGKAANAVVASARTFRGSAHQAIVLGVPDAINGAYVARGAFMGIFADPSMHATPLTDAEPFAIVKAESNIADSKPIFYLWNKASQKLESKSPQIDSSAEPIAATIEKYVGASSVDGKLLVTKFGGEAVLQPPGNPWTADFLNVELDQASVPASAQYIGLRYGDDITPQQDLWQKFESTANGKLRTSFDLRVRPDWFLASSAKDVRLLLPAKAEYKIARIDYLPLRAAAPEVTFRGTTFGTVLEFPANRGGTVLAACSNPECKSVRLEVLKPLADFEQEHHAEQSKSLLFARELSSTKGEFNLTVKDFGAPGFYRARVSGLDAAGKTLPITGDSFTIHITP